MSSANAHVRTWMTILLAVGALAACRTYQRIDMDAVTSEVEPGDQVRVLEKNGAKRAFEVTAIDAESIEGPGVRIPLDEIARIEVERISFWRSLLAGLGIGYVAVIAFVGIVGFTYLVFVWG